MKSVYDALPFIKARGLRSLAMPNPANWGFDYHTFLVVRAAAACCSERFTFLVLRRAAAAAVWICLVLLLRAVVPDPVQCAWRSQPPIVPALAQLTPL